MKSRWAIAAFLLGTALLAQTPPPPCPADRPVDDIITEVHKQQSKMKHRNTNPFPYVSCIFGWCRDRAKSQPTSAPPPTQGDKSQAEAKNSDTQASSSKSSSNEAVNDCDIATEQALEAAHNVDVGDFSFNDKNFNGALMRYQDANEKKPGDAAIHVRIGRAFEKLNQIQQAIEQYNAALKSPGPEKWTDEAKAALARLQH